MNRSKQDHDADLVFLPQQKEQSTEALGGHKAQEDSEVSTATEKEGRKAHLVCCLSLCLSLSVCMSLVSPSLTPPLLSFSR